MPIRSTRIRRSGMKRVPQTLAAAQTLSLLKWSFALSDPVTLTVRVNQPGLKIDPIFYGLMTEEINYSYDGGLYGELIRNRIFQDRPMVPRGPRPGGGESRRHPGWIPGGRTVKIRPQGNRDHHAGPSFVHELPAHSVTVIRLKTR